MKPAYLISRLLHMPGWLVAAAGVMLVCVSSPARADQMNQHDTLVNQYVSQMHADPLVADCAAHGSFIAGTSSAIDHVEFTPSSFDSTHSSSIPWNDAFDHAKQRTKVDTVVTVSGSGIRRAGAPIDLKFRCGYVGHQMMAFSWNDPVPAARRVSGEPGVHRIAHRVRVCRRHGRHHYCEYARYKRRHVSRSHRGYGRHASYARRRVARHHGRVSAQRHGKTNKHHASRSRTRRQRSGD